MDNIIILKRGDYIKEYSVTALEFTEISEILEDENET